jgi:hypothetical protein
LRFRFEIINPKLVFTALYGMNFGPKTFTDITMPAKLVVGQILARDPQNSWSTFYEKL